jgi:hypothetical protein
MSLNEFNSNLKKYLVHFLWRQWAQLGLAAASTGKKDGWIIDPEALWLFSATFARYDARLFDEILDWISKNATFINIPRLKSLARRFGFDEMNVVAAMAAAVSQKKSRLNWRFSRTEKRDDATPLFLDVSGEPLPDFEPYDDIFLRFGFKRGKVELRGLSRQFNPVMPECALLRLRALFGITARAETVLYLLTHDMAHPSHIARETGFSQKNVQDTLVDISGSGLVHPAKLEGRMKMYFMKKDHRAPFLYLPESPPQWITWPPVFRGLQMLSKGVSKISSQPVSELLKTAELRRLFGEVQSKFEQGGAAGLLTRNRGSSDAEAAASFLSQLKIYLG